jgi:hypothetical protein
MGSDIYAYDAVPPREVTVIPFESGLVNGGVTERFIRVPDDFHQLLELALIARSGGEFYASHAKLRIMIGKKGEVYNTHDTGEMFLPGNWNIPVNVIGELDLKPLLPAPLEPGDIVRVWFRQLNSTVYIYILGLRLKYR